MDELLNDGQTSEAPVDVQTPSPETPAAAPSSGEPAQSAPTAAPPAAQQDWTIPGHVLLRTREELGGKLSQSEARRIEAERKLAEIERQRREAAAQAPNILDDPEAYHQWVNGQFSEMRRGYQQSLESARTQVRLESSEDKWTDKLGEEKMTALRKWIGGWDEETHTYAMKQRDPYGWAWSEYETLQKAERAKTFEQKLNGKDLDAYIEEQVAARLAAASAPAGELATSSGQPRDPSGKFAPSQPQSQQRHRPESLSIVNGAPAPRGGEQRSGYDAAFNKG